MVKKSPRLSDCITDCAVSPNSFSYPSLANDFSSQEDLDGPEPGGLDASLTDEDIDDILDLQIAKHHETEVM